MVSRIGAQLPKNHFIPTFHTNLGEDAVDLASVAGLDLDPWQQEVLKASLGFKPSGKFSAPDVCLIVPRQNGKGSVIEARELAGLFLLPEKNIMHSAHEFKTAQEGFRRLKTLIEGCPELMEEGESPPKFKNSGAAGTVVEANGSRVLFAARSKGSGRGFTIDTVILDEAYELPENALDAMGPMQSAVPNPQMWFVSSTGMDDSVVLRRIREQGLAKNPNMAYFEWKSDDGCDPGDVEQWYLANPSLGIRITEDFLAGQYAKMSDLGFGREHLGLWADTEIQAVISQAVWGTLLDDESSIVGKMSFALDVAPDMSSAAVYVAGENKDGLFHVECAAVFDGTDGVPEYLKSIQEKYKPKSVALDPGGPAGALVPALNGLNVNFRAMNAGDVLSACGQFFNMATGNRMRHKSDEELADAVKGGIKRMVGAKGAWAWARKSPLDNITYLVAATYALYAYTAFEEETPKGGRVW